MESKSLFYPKPIAMPSKPNIVDIARWLKCSGVKSLVITNDMFAAEELNFTITETFGNETRYVDNKEI